MSADNGFTIHKVPGGYAAIMYFASDDHRREFNPARDKVFHSVNQAWNFAEEEWTEYGVGFSTEVRDELLRGSDA